jgi:hypothetical protein
MSRAADFGSFMFLIRQMVGFAAFAAGPVSKRHVSVYSQTNAAMSLGK